MTLFHDLSDAVARSRAQREANPGSTMATAPKFYLTTAIHYTNGPPHIGHAMRYGASDAIARFKRLDGYDGLRHDRHRRARPEGAAHGRPERPVAEGIRRRHRRPLPGDGAAGWAVPSTASSAPPTPTTSLDAGAVAADGGQWRHLPVKYAGWYSIRDEAFYADEETTLLADGTRLGGQGTPVEWVERELFLPAEGLSGAPAEALRRGADFVSPPTRRNEIVSFVKSRARGPLDQPHHLRLGAARAGDPKHVMYVWVDALNNYVTGTGFPDPQNPRAHYWPADVHIIARTSCASTRSIGPAFLMSAGCLCPGVSSAMASCSPRARRCRNRSAMSSTPSGWRMPMRRSAALFLPARGLLWPRRQLQPRSHRRPHQCRPRQRPRQPRPALTVDDRQEL